jgi:DNA gyrase subunit A
MSDQQPPKAGDTPGSIPPGPPPERSQTIHIEDELKRSYLDYAMSVIIGRALPDVRDGLKPVHRRVLYGMWESGNRAGRAYKKSARIVGDVMGKYHPHGDGPIYDTVVRMAQDFSMRYLLVDGQGNFGSIDGDNPAAMRYTEVRLTRLSEELLRDDIDKETVEWQSNYDGSETEPLVLPSRIPNLLVNGSSGIAVGMATNIPPHNLAEVIEALLLLIEDEEVSIPRLMTVLPGPDFPTRGTIHGRAGIQEAYLTGRGSIQIRGAAKFEDIGKDRQAIVIYELPYQVNKARLVERIAELVREKKIEGISDLRDESDRDGIRVVVELKRGEIAEVILNNLYKQTQLQVSFGLNMLAIVDNQPRVLNLKQLLEYFLDHRKTVVIRRVRFDLRKAEARAHIVEGLLKAIDIIDEIIAAIRRSQSPEEAKAALVQEFAFSELQAQAILEMRLQRLTGLEREKLVEEFRELMALIERLRAILASDSLLLEVIKDELLEIKTLYGDKRRTAIIENEADITLEDMIADEDMVITVTRTGYIKRSPLALYRAQGRGGKGRKGMDTKDGDFVEHLYVASAHSYVLVFTASGRVYWLKVHRIPELGPASKGKAIVNLLELGGDERVATTVAVREFGEGFLVFATQSGTIKKTELRAFANPRVGGIIAISIDEGDRLLDVRVTDGRHDLMLATADGFSIRFPEEDEQQEDSGTTLTGVRAMGRAAYGVRGIQLRPDDRVVAMEALEKEGDLLTVTTNGFGKRTAIAEYRRQSRGGMGIINLKVSDKTGPVVGVKQVKPENGVMLITQDGKLIRISAGHVSLYGRSTQGVKVMDLDSEDRLVALAKVEGDERDLAEEGLDGIEGADGVIEAPEANPETPAGES